MATLTNELGLPASLQGTAKQGKSKNKKGLTDRGPTALPKNRGTGFEGKS